MGNNTRTFIPFIYFACRNFPTEFTHGSNSAKVFSREGFGDWKHASGRNGALQRHETSIVHIKSIIAWKGYKLLQESNKTLFQICLILQGKKM